MTATLTTTTLDAEDLPHLVHGLDILDRAAKTLTDRAIVLGLGLDAEDVTETCGDLRRQAVEHWRSTASMTISEKDLHAAEHALRARLTQVKSLYERLQKLDLPVDGLSRMATRLDQLARRLSPQGDLLEDT